MQCREFEQRLQVAADLRQDPPVDAEFELHASLCADCSAKRDWFLALAKMTGAFRKNAGFSAADGSSSIATYDRVRLIRETWSRTAQEEAVVLAPTTHPSTHVASPVVEPPRRRSRLLLAGSGFAVAASIALFVTLAFLPASRPNPESASEVALAPQETPEPETPSPAPVVAETLPAPPAVGPALLLTGSKGPLSLEQLRQRLSSLPSDPSMTGSLRPITSSFGVAWETLRSALPTGQAEDDPTLDQADVRAAGPFAVA